MVRENMSLFKSQLVLKTGIWISTNSVINTAKRLLFLTIVFPNERIDTAKRPNIRIATVEMVVWTDKPVKFCIR
jgi:hypothetical protein